MSGKKKSVKKSAVSDSEVLIEKVVEKTITAKEYAVIMKVHNSYSTFIEKSQQLKGVKTRSEWSIVFKKENLL